MASSGVASIDATGAPDGGACIKLAASAAYYGGVVFTLDPGSVVNAEIYPLLDVQFKLDDTYSGTGTLLLWDSSSKVVSKNISVSPDEAWHTFEVGVGSAYVNQWEHVEVGFDWTHIAVCLIVFWFQDVGAGDFRVHALYFGGRRFAAVAQDAASQAAYGLREYVETDEELWSDNECDLRAKALLANLKDPAEYLKLASTILDYGSSPILAGDKVHVQLPTEGVDGDFRVATAEYHVLPGGQTLEIALELGREPPQLADYIYGLRPYTVNVEKLSRTKVGKRGVPVSTGGGGGLSGSVFSSNVDIDKTFPVLNLLTSRVLKAAFGFDGANVFVVSYAGDLILRSASGITRPFADGTDDLGSASFRFNNAYLKGALYVGGSSVITAARVLQNVTADAAIITSGELSINRMPRDAAGLVIEAQGTGFYPMYVNPNGRYSPASHGHPFTAISGLLAMSQLPQDTAGLCA